MKSQFHRIHLLLAFLGPVFAITACKAGAENLSARTAKSDAADASLAEPMARPPRVLSDAGSFYVQGDDAAHPRVRYPDGQVALNDSCAILLGNKLSRRIPPMYVNGQPIGFC